MQDTLKHQWQTAIKVNSDMLDETKRVAENSSVGTSEIDNILRIGSNQLKDWTSEPMSQLILPERYHNEIRNANQDKFTDSVLNRWYLEVAMRDAFRSVWDTVFCVNSLAELFVDNPDLISTRNILGMQRDLVDKIIDIPFIHLNKKGRQYIEFRHFVYGSRKFSYLLLENTRNYPEELNVLTVRKGLVDFLDLLNRYRVFCEDNGDRETVTKVCEVMLDFIDMYNNIENFYNDLPDKDVRKMLGAKMRSAENLLIARYVKRYYPEWGDWTKLSREEQEKRSKDLKSWSKLKLRQKLPKGLLRYIDGDDDFYNLSVAGFKTSDMNTWCRRLPDIHHRFSGEVHDLVSNPIHNEREWVENSAECEQWHMLNLCVIALYVAATHLYHFAGISRDSDETKSLARMFRESQNIV